MKANNLYEILQETTQAYRKGEPVEHKKAGTQKNNFEKIDMIFVDIVVDKKRAESYRAAITRLLDNYPQPERLAGGPSYIELAPNLEMEQEAALRLMALGKTLELWEIVSGKTLGFDYANSRELAEHGILMISGYRGKQA